MMSRNLRGFMSLFHSDKPVDLQDPRLLRRRRHRHGALLRPDRRRGPGEDRLSAGAGLGRADVDALGPSHRPRAGPAPAADRRLDRRDDRGRMGAGQRGGSARRARRRFEGLLERVARLPVNQLVMHKLAINAPLLSQGLYGNQVMSVFFDGIARHTPEGYEFAASGRRGGVQGGGAPARRAVRRPRTVMNQVSAAARHPLQHRRPQLGDVDLREPLRLLRARHRRRARRAGVGGRARRPPRSRGRPRRATCSGCSSRSGRPSAAPATAPAAATSRPRRSRRSGRGRWAG